MMNEAGGTVVAEYKRYILRKIIFIVVCATVAIVAFGISVGIGARQMEIGRVYELLFNHIMGVTYPVNSTDWVEDAVIWDYRLPRSLFALLAGASLAVAGVAMQSVMNNPLADAYTTGVSSGACFGVAVAIVLGFTLIQNEYSSIAITINAFLFAMIPVAAILAISPRTKSPATLILAGIAIGYIFNAMSTLLLTSTEEETLARIYVWQIGSIDDIIWSNIPIVAVASIIGLFVVGMLSRKLNVLSLGETSAKAMGVNVQTMRYILLLLMAFMVASVISYAGIIGFVGLVSPHIVRILIDSDNRFVVPASAMLGASLLPSDIAERFYTCRCRDILRRSAHLLISVGEEECKYLVIFSHISVPRMNSSTQMVSSQRGRGRSFVI